MDQRCLDCHREIAWQLERNLGLHSEEGDSGCAVCHPDHAGVEFELIEWPEGSPEHFDHRRTGWPLTGRHSALACRECHKPDLQSSPVMELLEHDDRSVSWMGLERDCLSCHTDTHQGTLSPECRNCHTLKAWTPAEGFEHAETAFPLAGKHTNIDCNKCHLVPGRVFLTDAENQPAPRFKPVAFESCSACHTDPHTGRLGGTCTDCHVVEGFSIVPTEKFDHSMTRYTLNGKHRQLECADCHDPQRAWGKKPVFQSCGSCHTDPHAGKATLAGQAADCRACHDERSFKPATYSVNDHQGTVYPLDGRHREVGCDQCHIKRPAGSASFDLGSAGIQIRPAFNTCRDCHQESHGTQLADRQDGGACESCHTVGGWKPSTYTLSDHSTLALSLLGRHAESECSACHGPTRKDLSPLPDRSILGTAGVWLTSLDSSCSSCHYDPHLGRLENDCRTCHGVDSFSPSNVDTTLHQEFDYRLEAGHRTVPCMECHTELNEPPSQVSLLRVEELRPLSFSEEHELCRDCHTTPHRDQFDRRSDGGDCSGCHSLDAFKPAVRFDHQVDASFPLDDAHRDVACARCHTASTDATGQQIIIYRPLPHQCRDCHIKNAPKGTAQ
jgi:hypothetical protein